MASESTLRDEVRRVYDGIAAAPAADHPFRFGLGVAERAGYSPDDLARLPSETTQAFAGISCLPCFAQVEPGSHVLDLGCGAGLDSLLLAPRAASVLGIDFSEHMLERARTSAQSLGLTNVRFELGDAESIPLDQASVDIAVVNGIFNLNPGRAAIFSELARVIRPGGLLFAAELVLKGPLPPEVAASETDWFA